MLAKLAFPKSKRSLVYLPIVVLLVRLPMLDDSKERLRCNPGKLAVWVLLGFLKLSRKLSLLKTELKSLIT